MMDEKMGKRKPMFARKPSLVVAVETQMAKKPEAKAEQPEMEGVVCPKCGMELADTPANREYSKMRAEEGEEMESDEDEE